MAESEAANGMENGTQQAGSGAGLPGSSWIGLRKPRNVTVGDGNGSLPVDGWSERSDFLHTCVALGLNARQIHQLSLSTPHPVTTVQQVYDMIQNRGLDRLYNSGKIKRRRMGPHNQQIISTFAKLYGQACELGHDVTDVIRDEVPCPGARFRPDLGIRIPPRQFYVEVQLSKLQLTRWTAKMSNYLRLYKLMKQPFRALFMNDRPDDIVRLREFARWVLRDRPDLNLFLFLSLDDFARERNVMTTKVWQSPWSSKDRFSLL